jgi:hypothetical protein
MDVVRQAAPLFDKIRIVGSDTGTKVDAFTEDMHLFLGAELTPAAELAGEFGLSNLATLKKLFEIATYKSDNAQLLARREARSDHDFVAELIFRDGQGGQFHFRTINPKMMGRRPQINTLQWSIAVEPTRAKVNEVVELAGMLAQFDQHFSVSFQDGALLLHIGSRDSNSHNATVPLATDLDEVPLPTCAFRATYLVTILKTVGNWPLSIRFAPEEGVTSLLITTDHGSYNYVLRGRDD